MTRTLQVGIKELKNGLSAYLREVRKGRRILVTDRGEVIAELHRAHGELDPAEEALKEWLDAGAVVPPRRPKRSLPEPLVRLPAGTSLRILDELRGGD